MAMYIDSGGFVEKTILHSGKEDLIAYPKDTKVTFHFRTQKQDDDNTVIDDSQKLGRPMELIIGKKFKLEVWELCLKTMRVGEVARFSVDKSLVVSYPWVSKTLRKALGGKKDNRIESSHCCGMMSYQQEGLGYPELDDLAKNLQSLNFTIELLKAELPGNYDQESWAMNDDEKLRSVPNLREEGNELYRKEEYELAAAKYAEALGRLEHLILREKPGDEEWRQLDQMKIPLLLNYSQCRLILQDYYAVIEHTTTVLEKDPENVKAHFRRAKAHVGAWNPDEARKDFQQVADLDPMMSAAVKKELQHLDELQRKKDEEDAKQLRGKMF